MSTSVLICLLLLNSNPNLYCRFLLAQLQFDSVASQNNVAAIENALSRLPDDLDKMYEQALERVRSQKAADVILAEKIISWVAFSFELLSIEQLQHATATELGNSKFYDAAIVDRNILLSVCGGLVILDEQSNLVRLVRTCYELRSYHRKVDPGFLCRRDYPSIF